MVATTPRNNSRRSHTVGRLRLVIEETKRERERGTKKILAGGKNKEERTPVGCDEHRANQAVSSSTEHIVLKLGARSRHCCNWMEECKEEGE
jgi:hypothetical protein